MEIQKKHLTVGVDEVSEMDNSIMCSIDAATKLTGFAVFTNGKLTAHHLIDYSKIKDVDERSKEMARSLCTYLDKYRPNIIYIEQPKGRQNIELVRKLSRILGVVLGWAAVNNAFYEEVMPSVWRKYVPEFSQGGKERDDLKEESMRVCQEIFGFEPDDDNVADACLIGYGMINRYASDN